MNTKEIFLDTTSSTMDEARKLIANFTPDKNSGSPRSELDFLLVSAQMQTSGKGTRGRIWLGDLGNIFITFGIHRKYLSNERLALFPLEFGVWVWETAAENIYPENRASLKLKWPNDLMYRGFKTAGILMESLGNYVLVGLGVNVVRAPEIFDGGKSSMCLSEAGMGIKQNSEFIASLYLRLQKKLQGEISEHLLLDWQAKVDWNARYRIRDREGQPQVKIISINAQGHLQVENEDGNREWLIADYLL